MRANPIAITSAADFEKLLNRLSADIVEAPAYLRLHKELNESLREYHREMNDGCYFWSMTITAAVDAGLIRLARIYDQNASALSLGRLLSTLEAHPEFFTDEAVKARVNPQYAESMHPKSHLPDSAALREYKNFASDSDPLVRKIMLHRNTLTAHISAKRTLQSNFTQSDQLTVGDAQKLCERAFTIFNHCTHLFRASMTSDLIIGEEGALSSVLKFLRMGLEAHDRQIQAEADEWERRIRGSNKAHDSHHPDSR